MTPREQEIIATEKLIKELKASLKRLKSESEYESFLYRRLRDFPDFPNIKTDYSIWDRIENRLKIYTVNDLINTDPYEFKKFRGFGKVRMKQLEDWMKKYNLMFLIYLR